MLMERCAMCVCVCVRLIIASVIISLGSVHPAVLQVGPYLCLLCELGVQL